MSSPQRRLSQLSSIMAPAKNSTRANLVPVAPAQPYRVCVIGSGNWGTTIAKVIAENTAAKPELFQNEVKMWVFEETINGEKLTDIINTKHQNIKYLPDITLPTNLIADPLVVSTVDQADLIVFNIPHQFLANVCKQIKGKVLPTARAVSCLKGLAVSPEDGCQLLTDFVEAQLGIHCGALSGANIASEVALEKWSETTIGYTLPADFRGPGKDIDAAILKATFHRPYFHVRVVEDVPGVSILGALKNIVAIAVGFVEGSGWGSNAKAAIMRIGLIESIKFVRFTGYGDCSQTFTSESAGVADLITTCSGGRNVKIGRHMAATGKSAWECEKELLNGQSSQGIITAQEVHEFLLHKGATAEFPLFEATYQIIFGTERIENLPHLLEEK
ncbi:hypothetical protein BABINDRAFT_32429 [Babjeviella inositovora NRRL Y-12698]|uniref:Glycerol-3-phosphate dehydrogenase [NAD(+)] n=1 Tax=Babjeviella inositovora NRRL Y-12698 TaxID=984486 RepID=A0A1E3QYI3_9ASCO|nr:uncharacterized protein BABINDRAFT_32429 [Babjeviella inositovora NRRL Y-12698]ODQ82137.1 hypothetical protein BABINDRAFT_32429 [Babjeviella inositovora NRRL Y-12698]